MAIITLSRGLFSGARDLAQRISENFGYKLVSREDIIEKTAHYGMSEEVLDKARRRRLGVMQRMDLEWLHYRVYALAALTKEIREGGLVYLGSNGRALLRGFPTVLNIRVVADMNSRIDNLIKRTDYVIDRKLAKRLIEQIDEKKARWQRTLHKGVWNESSEFDLQIETGCMTIPEACELIHSTLEQPGYQSTRQSLEAINLLTAAADLRAKIAMKGDVLDDKVEVEVRNDSIIITGSVRTVEDMAGIKALLDSSPFDSNPKSMNGASG